MSGKQVNWSPDPGDWQTFRAWCGLRGLSLKGGLALLCQERLRPEILEMAAGIKVAAPVRPEGVTIHSTPIVSVPLAPAVDPTPPDTSGIEALVTAGVLRVGVEPAELDDDEVEAKLQRFTYRKQPIPVPEGYVGFVHRVGGTWRDSEGEVINGAEGKALDKKLGQPGYELEELA